MNFLNSWLQGIVLAVIIATIIEMIMPNGNNKKYIKVVLGVYIVFNIISPVVNKFANSNFKISSIMNINKYMKEVELNNIKTDNININSVNDENIRQIYISNLKEDMKAKLKEKGYLIYKIEIKVDNSSNYNIEKIDIYLKNEDNETVKNSNESSKIEKVEEIRKVKVQIKEENSNGENEIINNSSNVKEKDKNEIKKYISNIYEVDEKKIDIY